jgi:putative ABC transport system ATP-binding protein
LTQALFLEVDDMIALKTVNISKDFLSGSDSLKILKSININIRAGELTMLVGPSGCGKTTLISIMSGILSPTTGEVFIGDISLTRLTDLEKVLFRRSKIGFVFQQFNLLPSLTAAENAAVPLIAAGVSMKIAVAKAGELLEKLDMQAHVNKFPNQLSGGQQQRVAFARALIHAPKIIVCDEPTASLDATSGRQVMNLLSKIAVQKDSAVVLVTHDNRIFDFADRVFYMSDGQIEKEEEFNKRESL